MIDEQRARLDGFSAVLRNLGQRSAPEGRAAKHLLFADIHDCWRTVYRDPASLTEGEPPESKE